MSTDNHSHILFTTSSANVVSSNKIVVALHKLAQLQFVL